MLLNGYAVANPKIDGANADPDKFSDWEVVGLSGGDVRVIAIDPKDVNRLYISTLDGQSILPRTRARAGPSW